MSLTAADVLSSQVVLPGSDSSVLLSGLSAQTLYHVSIFPVYEENVGSALRGTVTTRELLNRRSG